MIRNYNGINYSTVCMDKIDFNKLKTNIVSTNGFTYEDIHTLVYGN